MSKAMQVYFQVLGGHTHVAIFTGPAGEHRTLGRAGELCMTNEEFEEWRNGTIELRFSESKNTVADTHTTAVPYAAEGAKP